MSHTNTTANYNLPQFVGTDKPSWLTDVNGAMTSIDTQMKANADANTTTAGDLNTLAGRVTTAEQNITTQGSTLQTVSNVASTASTNASNAMTKASEVEAFIALTNFKDKTASAVTGSASIEVNEFNCATNNAGSYGKMYGWLQFIPTSTGGCTIRIPTDFVVSEAFNMKGLCLMQDESDGRIYPLTINVDTNGNFNIIIASAFYNHRLRLNIIACPIYAKSFGD